VLTEIREREAGEIIVVVEETGRRLRDESLPTVPQRADSRRSMD
jgi:hypothetical protein